jgi:hypothetical protein
MLRQRGGRSAVDDLGLGGLAVGAAAAFAAMLGFAVGIEAMYRRPLWLLFTLAEVVAAKDFAGPTGFVCKPREGAS